jgi:NADH dehydrogenase (ubiquinone) 1 alpha subcomplex subunit 9
MPWRGCVLIAPPACCSLPSEPLASTTVRCLSAAASAPPSSSSSSSSSLSANYSNPLNAPKAGGLGVAALARAGGRSSVSGIVATVFGGSGFLGRYVVNHLGRIGSQVITPYRGDGMNVRHLKLAGDLGQIVPIPYDMADMESIRRCIARSNVVINLIGSRNETNHYSFDDVHVKIPYRLAQVSKSLGVERFIHVSAMGADLQSESKFFRSKALGEQTVREFYPDATILRPTTLFGPQDRFLSYYAYVGHKLAAIPLTRGGERKIQPVFVADVARAILNSIADPSAKGQTYDLGGPKTYTEAEIIALVAKHTSSDVKAYYMSDPVARIYGSIIGGRRGVNINLDRELTPLAPVINTIGAFLNKLTLPAIFHHDLVAQAHTDLVVDHSPLPGLRDLGVEVAMPLDAQIDRILFPHRLEAPDRFPEAELMKRDAKDNASY